MTSREGASAGEPRAVSYANKFFRCERGITDDKTVRLATRKSLSKRVGVSTARDTAPHQVTVESA